VNFTEIIDYPTGILDFFQGKKCQESSLELKLSVSLVKEPTIFQGNTYDGIKADWSLKTTYGSNLFTSCPRSKLSKIYIDVTTNKVFTFS